MLNFKTVSIVVLATAALAFVGCSKKKEEVPASTASDVPAEVSNAVPVEPVAAPSTETSTSVAETPATEEKADNQAIATIDKPST
ncbi:hypothetical protein RFH42_03385 [Acinetobacter rudis]|uniref:hypothetical protein n=1 Tax=Acinetobacter rudis TaxID=632955 RepID=UPI00280E5B8E|nr:hypothetical protein [Acinetobacter rudis]MDQ8951997.1 hypothetical protein [Acinetobacter rudis]